MTARTILSRRTLLAGGAALIAAPASGQAGPLGPGAALGWAALDLRDGRRLGAGADLRLPMCSPFKWLLAAYVLWRVDRGRERLDRPLPLTRRRSTAGSRGWRGRSRRSCGRTGEGSA